MDYHYFQKSDSRCVTDSLKAPKVDFPLTRQRSRLFFVQILIRIDEQQISKNQIGTLTLRRPNSCVGRDFDGRGTAGQWIPGYGW